MALPGARLPVWMISLTWTMVAHSEDSHGNDGCLTEAVAAAHGDNPENTDCQIGKAHLKLKGIPGRPADDSATESEMKT